MNCDICSECGSPNLLVYDDGTMSSSLVAQTLKETVRGKYGENLGTAETTVRGGKSVTVYKDKYGQVTRKGTVKGN